MEWIVLQEGFNIEEVARVVQDIDNGRVHDKMGVTRKIYIEEDYILKMELEITRGVNLREVNLYQVTKSHPEAYNHLNSALCPIIAYTKDYKYLVMEKALLFEESEYSNHLMEDIIGYEEYDELADILLLDTDELRNESQWGFISESLVIIDYAENWMPLPNGVEISWNLDYDKVIKDLQSEEEV